jgi:XTP/dITP diphosphohydrolase
MTTLVIATRNLHKVGEIKAILGDRFNYRTLRDYPEAPCVVEDASTFAGNATKKAVELAAWLSNEGGSGQTRTYVLADDSGLEVDSLNGAPGVRSARFAAQDLASEGNSADEDNNAKLLRLLKEVPLEKRSARFRCVIALTPVLRRLERTASPVCALNEFEFQTRTFSGTCEGSIGFEPKGRGGFGYDPLFTPEGGDQTFAELEEEAKNQLSHRARALAELKRSFTA